MFSNATSFNQDIHAWNVENVTFMENTFSGATAFNQDISLWDISKVTDMTGMFDNSDLSDTNYDIILAMWDLLPSVQDDVPLGAAGIHYCASESYRASLISSHNWIITDGGRFCPPTVTSFTPTFGAAGATITITGY
ncbi:MAG: BspA family leucine-rich repeat surface protein [Bacteroidota bacterium]